MTLRQIAERAGVNRQWLSKISLGRVSSGKVQAVTALAVLGVSAPSLSECRGRVGAIGTRRRLQALAMQGWSSDDLAVVLRQPARTLRMIRDGATKLVGAQLAASVVAFFDQNPDVQGPSQPFAGGGFLPGPVWRHGNIDDPSYDPMQKATSVGLSRRLRAMAAIGHGASHVGARIGEQPAQVDEWMAGAPAPAYVRLAICELFDRTADPGPDAQARAAALAAGWASPVAWLGCDIDDPSAQAQLDGSRRAPNEVDSSQVDGAIAGHVPQQELTTAERKEVVAALRARGWTDRQIGNHLRWSNTEKRSGSAVMRFRRLHRIDVTPRPLQPAG